MAALLEASSKLIKTTAVVVVHETKNSTEHSSCNLLDPSSRPSYFLACFLPTGAGGLKGHCTASAGIAAARTATDNHAPLNRDGMEPRCAGAGAGVSRWCSGSVFRAGYPSKKSLHDETPLNYTVIRHPLFLLQRPQGRQHRSLHHLLFEDGTGTILSANDEGILVRNLAISLLQRFRPPLLHAIGAAAYSVMFFDRGNSPERPLHWQQQEKQHDLTETLASLATARLPLLPSP